MFYVICPECGCRTEIPAEAIGSERTDLYNVTRCDECPATFDYDDDDVQNDGEQATA
jgi:uncharacterized Zn finger protein